MLITWMKRRNSNATSMPSPINSYYQKINQGGRKKGFVDSYLPLLKKPCLLLTVFLYIATGMFQPLAMDVLKYNGAAKVDSFVYNLPLYVGLIVMIFINPRALKVGRVPWGWVILLDVMDCLAMAGCYGGNLLAGSLIYTTIYSSVTIWCALFSVIFLRKRLAFFQWLGCVLVTGGVALSAVEASLDKNKYIFLGAVLVIVGTMIHSSTYILSDYILHLPNPIEGELLCSLNGIGGLIAFTIWVLAYTVPRWDELVTSNVKKENGSWTVIWLAYGACAILAGVHAVCFFKTIKQMGAVSAAVCKGLQACGVFFLAHLFFCDKEDPEKEGNCFTAAKGISFVVVLFGVVIYSIATSKKSEKGRSTEEGFPSAITSPQTLETGEG